MRKKLYLLISCGMAATSLASGQADFENLYLSLSFGGIGTHPNFPAKSGLLTGIQLGYDINEPLSLELGLWDTPTKSRDNERMSLTQGTLDALYHFTRWETLDPYLSLGLGLLLSDIAIFDSDKAAMDLRLGGGTFYHLSETTSLRASLSTMIASYKARPAATGSVGVAWTF